MSTRPSHTSRPVGLYTIHVSSEPDGSSRGVAYRQCAPDAAQRCLTIVRARTQAAVVSELRRQVRLIRKARALPGPLAPRGWSHVG